MAHSSTPTPPANFRGHGSPYGRGAADAYYRRPFSPHKWLDPLGRQIATGLDADELDEYHKGYEQQDERKEWE